jgi:outer membrane receptor protein involved in Fe transport
MNRTGIGKCAAIVSLLISQGELGWAQHVAVNAPSQNSAELNTAVMMRPVTVRLDKVSRKQGLRDIAASAGVTIQYRGRVIDASEGMISVHAQRRPLGLVLADVLAGTNLEAIASASDAVTIRPAEPVVVQGTINGHVRDSKTNLAVRGAKVVLDDAKNGVVTGEDGSFRLAGVTAGEHTVSIRMIGYSKQARSVTVRDGEASLMELRISRSVNALEQVVVTGTVVATELKAVPNAITVITAKQIQDRGITRIDQLFRGDVPGMFASNAGAPDVLAGAVVFSRGVTAVPGGASRGTVYGTNAIKTYVDGIELADPGTLFTIDPRSIDRIEILTGPQASTIYGSGAINGVMQIFTKRGTASRPQLTISLSSGLVQNNLSTALTPQHEYNGQLSGVDGRVSYSVGASWNRTGSWTPSVQLVQRSVNGGLRFAFATPVGALTADASLRRNSSQNVARGNMYAIESEYVRSGYYKVSGPHGNSQPNIRTISAQTIGATINYAPFPWWSHALSVGQDVSSTESRDMSRGYSNPGDTSYTYNPISLTRNVQSYSTTARIPLVSFVNATVTLGADSWQTLRAVTYVNPQTLSGNLIGFTSVSRQPEHNTGAFLQSQFNISDHLFLTYGLRMEWNPSFGQEALPNYAPRYGIAYAKDIGLITAKLRASYGRSTRPPYIQQKNAIAERYLPSVAEYGAYDTRFANPNLEPEHQQGGEGGVELYFGTRGSLIVTRYNQTVDGLIATPVIDSVRSLLPNPQNYWSLDANGYGYQYQQKSLNVGSIRNQGWEIQGSLVTGPITTRGNYNWTKSRMIGIAPRYRDLFSVRAYPQYQPGATFQYLPEHTWGTDVTYAHMHSTVALTVTGFGRVVNRATTFYQQALALYDIRLPQNLQNASAPYGSYVNENQGYTMADVMASHRLSARVEGVLQMHNLANYYTNDLDAGFPVLGRQTMLGLRIRL